jgi:hypothetical protein
MPDQWLHWIPGDSSLAAASLAEAEASILEHMYTDHAQDMFNMIEAAEGALAARAAYTARVQAVRRYSRIVRNATQGAGA